MLCTATCGKTKLVQPVDPTMTVSSGLGSEAKMYRNAMDSGHPAQSECSSISSFDVPMSFQPRDSLPYVALVTRSWYSGGMISKNSGAILIRSLLMKASSQGCRLSRFPFVNYQVLRVMNSVTQLPRPASAAERMPSACLICSTIISGDIVIPPQTCGPAMTRSLLGMDALISRAIQPTTLNSGTIMYLAFLVASRISSPGQGRNVLILTSPTRMPSSASKRIASRPCDTAVPDETMMTSASAFSVSIRPSIQAIVCLRDRSIAAQTSCCQLAWVA